MKSILVAIKDKMVGFNMSPIKQHNEGMAIRNFSNMVNSQEKNYANEDIEDKELWVLGEFDETTGIITSNPRMIVRAIDMKKEVSHAGRPTDGGNSTAQATLPQ